MKPPQNRPKSTQMLVYKPLCVSRVYQMCPRVLSESPASKFPRKSGFGGVLGVNTTDVSTFASKKGNLGAEVYAGSTGAEVYVGCTGA